MAAEGGGIASSQREPENLRTWEPTPGLCRPQRLGTCGCFYVAAAGVSGPQPLWELQRRLSGFPEHQPVSAEPLTGVKVA